MVIKMTQISISDLNNQDIMSAYSFPENEKNGIVSAAIGCVLDTHKITGGVEGGCIPYPKIPISPEPIFPLNQS
jgi:hypothetical protein